MRLSGATGGVLNARELFGAKTWLAKNWREWRPVFWGLGGTQKILGGKRSERVRFALFYSPWALNNNKVADWLLDIVQDNETCLLLLAKTRRGVRCAKLSGACSCKNIANFHCHNTEVGMYC